MLGLQQGEGQALVGSWVMVWELLGDGAQIRVLQGQDDDLDLGCS